MFSLIFKFVTGVRSGEGVTPPTARLRETYFNSLKLNHVTLNMGSNSSALNIVRNTVLGCVDLWTVGSVDLLTS